MEKKSFDPLGGASHERVYHRNDASIYTGRKPGSIGSQIAASEPVRTDSPTSTHSPKDGFITLLAGAHGLVEINMRLRADPGLQAAFGRTGCAEQSVVQQTLDRCTTENVEQMQQAVDCIYREHSRGARHTYQADW
jgi:hypothetical protein